MQVGAGSTRRRVARYRVLVDKVIYGVLHVIMRMLSLHVLLFFLLVVLGAGLCLIPIFSNAVLTIWQTIFEILFKLVRCIYTILLAFHLCYTFILTHLSSHLTTYLTLV
jgi:hypothetical protein